MSARRRSSRSCRRIGRSHAWTCVVFFVSGGEFAFLGKELKGCSNYFGIRHFLTERLAHLPELGAGRNAQVQDGTNKDVAFAALPCRTRCVVLLESVPGICVGGYQASIEQTMCWC